MQMSLAPPPGHAMPPVTEQRQTGGGVRLRQMNAPPQQKKAYAFQHPLLAVPMVCIVTVLFGWSWYVHVLIMDVGLLRDGGSGVVLGAVDVAVWHVILLFAYTSYMQTVLTQPGYTTTGRGAHSLAALEAGLTPAQRDARYCTTCCSYKPQRCHHCRMCGRCVEKMDHHCPWVANCVGKYNHKFFVLFVLYSAFTALYNAGTLVLWTNVYESPAAADAAQGTTSGRVSLSLSFFFTLWANVLITGVFGVVLVCFGGFHLWLIARNSTTLETMRDENYHKGSVYANFEVTCGPVSWQWALPCYGMPSEEVPIV